MLDLENVQFFVKENNVAFWVLLVLSVALFIGPVIYFKKTRGYILPLYSYENASFFLPAFLSIICIFLSFSIKTTNYAVVEVTQPEQCKELLNNQLSFNKFRKERDKLYFVYEIKCGEIDGNFGCQRPMTNNSLKEKIQEDFDNEVFKVNFKNEKDIKFLGI